MNEVSLHSIREILLSQATLSPQKATAFFKTGPGAYAEGDRFLGVTVPTLRKISKTCFGLPLETIPSLLTSSFHEERLLALYVLIQRYQQTADPQVIACYLEHLDHVNNWDLVDASAHHLLGEFLWGKEDKSLLLELVRAPSLWRRRISMVATWNFIRKGSVDWTFKLATLLLEDTHDLIHKGTGWMLREAGKQSPEALHAYLEIYAAKMPRTMLRYAIEKLSDEQRQDYLQRKKKL